MATRFALGKVYYRDGSVDERYALGRLLGYKEAGGGATPIGVTDAGSGSDGVSLAASVPISDAGSGTDILGLLAAVLITDTGAGADTPSVGAAVPVADSGGGHDDIGVVGAIDIIDSGTGADVISAILAVLAITDMGAGADGVTVDTGATAKSVADSGAGIDIITDIRAVVSVLDTATGADIVSILAALGVTDAGSGVDIVSAVAALAVVDAGSAADAVSQVLAQIIVAETGIGVDAAEIKAAIAVFDAGAGIDELLRWIVGTIVAVKFFDLLPMNRIVAVPAMARIVEVGPELRIVSCAPMERIVDLAPAERWKGGDPASWYGGELLVDGGLENWLSATNLTSWAEYIVGGSTVNREATEKHGGAYATRFDIDASNNWAQISQNFLAVAGNTYRAAFWYKTPAGKSAAAFVRATVGGTAYYLQPDGTWKTGGFGYHYTGPLESTAWARHERTFTAPAGLSGGTLAFGFNQSLAASASVYFDDASVQQVVGE